MKPASAFFIARSRKDLPQIESISKSNTTVGKRRNTMNLQRYTLCEVIKEFEWGKSGPKLPRKPIAQIAPTAFGVVRVVCITRT